MMLIKLLQFEWNYHSKQRSFIIFLVLFFLYGMLAITNEFQFLEISSMYNDAFNLNLLSGVISLGILFPCMFLCINGLLRDQTNKSEEIIFSTGLTKNNFFMSRFLAVFLTTLFLSSLAIFGVFIGVCLSNSNPETLHIFNFLHYLWPWLTLVLPNAFIISALLFSTTLLGRNAIITYIMGVVIIGVYWYSAFTINSPIMGGSSLSSPEIVSKAVLTDLFGLAPFFEQTQFLTPIEKNNYLPSFSGHFLWNRLLWIGISIVFLLVSYKQFTFRKMHSNSKQSVANTIEDSVSHLFTPVKTAPKLTKMKFYTCWSLIKLDFKSTLKSIPFLALLIIWIVLLYFSFNYATNGIEVYGSRYPTTDLLLGLIIEILPVFGLLLVVFYSGELIWRTRSFNFNGIIDATPVQNSVFFSAKIVVLALIPMVLILVAIATAILFQLSNGYFDVHISLYLSTFYYGGVQLVLYTIFCLFVQSVVANKYLGMVISGFVIILFGPLSSSIGLEHPLLLFNNVPSMARAYSDFTGYGHYISKFNWMTLHWTLFSGLLVLLSYKFWKRGSTSNFKMKTNWSFKEKIVFAGLLLLFSSTGGFIFHNTNSVNTYTTSDEAYDFNENYERKYKKYDDLTVPKLISVSTKMELYPSKNNYSVLVESSIENTNSIPMNEIFVTAKTPLSSLQIENSTEVFHDPILHTYLFKLKTPLLSNQRLKIRYQVNKTSTGFAVDNTISTNGTYIKSAQFSPFLGYVNSYEIRDPYERENRGLPVLESSTVTDVYLSKHTKFNFENVSFETIISTDTDQIAFSSGSLIKQWKTRERNYYHHKSEGKIDHLVAYFSGKYQLKKVTHKGVNIELYYLPEHHRNVSEMIKVTKATIDYCTVNFGVYPHKYLRIGEVSTFAGSNGQAMPGVISINERIFNKSVENPDSFNVVARVLVHEISHQWWGFLLTPKKIEGALFISESFAKYSETVILEKLYGKQMVNRLSAYTLRKYFTGRSRASIAEPALYVSAQQQYLAYSKGAIVLNAIRKLIGETALNKALKSLISKHNIEATATSLNFLEELYAVAPKENHALINDWIKRVITYDIGIKTATYKALNNNRYEVNVRISAQRYQTNKNGTEDKININEYIELGVYEQHQKQFTENETLYLKPQLINAKEMVFSFVVNHIPKYIALDPSYTRLDRNISNNVKLILPE